MQKVGTKINLHTWLNKLINFPAHGLIVGRLGFEPLSESDQKTLKIGIHSFPA